MVCGLVTERYHGAPTPRRQIIPLDGRLANDPAGLLLELPLLDSDEDTDLCMTSDQWVRVLARRKREGRPLHTVELGAHTRLAKVA